MALHRVKPKSVYSFYTPKYESITLLTHSVPHLRRWLRKNYIFVSEQNLVKWARRVDEEGRVKEVTLYLFNEHQRDLIIKTFGYYDPDYDHLSMLGKLRFKYYNKFGKLLKFKTFEAEE